MACCVSKNNVTISLCNINTGANELAKQAALMIRAAPFPGECDAMMMMMMISGISVIKVIARFSFQPRYYIHDYPLTTYDYLFTCCLASLHLLIIALYLFIISLNLFIIALYRRHGRRHRLTYVCHIIYMHTFVYIIMYTYH